MKANDSMSDVMSKLGNQVANNQTGNGFISPDQGRVVKPGCALYLPDRTIDRMVANNELVHRINYTIPSQATKLEPVLLEISNTKAKKLNGQFRRNWQKMLREAGYLANRYGTCYVLMHLEDNLGDDTPVNSTKQTEIVRLVYLTPENCRPAIDSYLYNYQEPEFYTVTINGYQTKVHHTRLLIFYGKRRYGHELADTNHQHEPAWLGSFTALQNWLEANTSALGILKDADVGVFKFGGLRDLLKKAATCAEAESQVTQQIYKRLSSLVDSSSILRKMIVDKDEEDYNFVSRDYSGVKEIISDFRNTFLGTCQLPASILFSNSENGSMFAEGSSGDRQLLASLVKEYQVEQLKPNLFKLYSAYLPGIDQIDITFPSTMEMTTTESSAAMFDLAKTLSSLVAAQIITPQQAAKRLKGKELVNSLDLSTEEVAGISDTPNTTSSLNTNNAGINTTGDPGESN
jgi:phage-related protein (TIGR01555 family)